MKKLNKICLPYGQGQILFEAEADQILTSRVPSSGGKNGEALVREAMARPTDSPRLRELAAGKKKAVIIISDHTRPVPSRDILPAMLREMREGNPEIEIRLLAATGCHRAMTAEELREKLGDEIMEREEILIHDAFDPERNVRLGTLPSGAELVIDKAAAEADLLAAEGFIEPHFFAGFSGGRKSVLPGICDRVTVLGNHCGAFIADPHARTGILEGNPIQTDMAAAARMAGLAYIVNVVLDEKKQTAAAFAGDPLAAHEAGTAYLSSFCKVWAEPADIVITTNGGAPLDQNLYQCVKGMTAAEAAAREGGVIILCAEMADGIGGESFYRSLRDCESPRALYEQYCATPQQETIADQWQSQILARILMKHRVILVTRPAMKAVVESMKMEYAPTVEEALDLAKKAFEKTPRICVIPDGVSVIVEKR